MHDEIIELMDTGWSAHAERFADCIENLSIVARTTETEKDFIELLSNISTIFKEVSIEPSRLSELPSMSEGLAQMASRNKERKQEMNSIKAAKAAVARKEISKLTKFSKKIILSREKKAIVLLRKSGFKLEEVAKHLNTRYATQIADAKCAPFSKVDISRAG
jgi:hypothetical protein